jgi:type IV pilus assembly protein PilO
MELSLNKMPWYAQVGLFVAIAVSGVTAFYYFYAAGAMVEMGERRQQLESLRTDINKGLATARQLPQFRSQVAELEARLNSLKAVLPEEKDFGDLLRSLQTLATQSSLAINQFKPAPVVTRPLHAEWPINIELEGTYHNLGLFFDRISRFSRIINVGNVAIRARDKQDPNATVQVSCVATTFVLLAESAIKAAAPSGALPPGATAPATLIGRGGD